MNKITKYLLVIITVLLGSCAKKNNIYNNNNTFSVGFYNVENLFDTINNPNNDEEFLPDSKLEWNNAKYTEKIGHINKVIHSLDYPIILGLCEIENANVLKDLIKSSIQLNKSYDFVHHESPDKRGIDAAFIYNKKIITLVESGKLKVNLGNKTPKPTRDIVWAKFVFNRDTIFTMVNHWPSRRGGTEASEHKRLKAAKAARNFIDSISKNPNNKVIFMGDLNDYPENKAPMKIKEVLKPMIFANSGKYGGTHCYKNHWGILDHIFISSSLDKGHFSVIKNSGKINDFDYLLTEYKGNKVPFRTFGGGKYLGGFSDHFPVTIKVKLE